MKSIGGATLSGAIRLDDKRRHAVRKLRLKRLKRDSSDGSRTDAITHAFLAFQQDTSEVGTRIWAPRTSVCALSGNDAS